LCHSGQHGCWGCTRTMWWMLARAGRPLKECCS
jgi:hypothetical protein